MEQLKRECDKRFLSNLGDEGELKQRLKQFLNNDIFIKQEELENDWIVCGFISI